MRQPPILLTQDVNSVPEDALHNLFLSVIIQVHVNHLHKEAGLTGEAHVTWCLAVAAEVHCCFGKPLLLQQIALCLTLRVRVEE